MHGDLGGADPGPWFEAATVGMDQLLAVEEVVARAIEDAAQDAQLSAPRRLQAVILGAGRSCCSSARPWWAWSADLSVQCAG